MPSITLASDCIAKIDGIIDMRARGELTEEEFLLKKGALSKEKLCLQELLNDTLNRVDKWLDAAGKVFDFARDAKNSFETGDLEAKRRVIAALGSNLILKDKVLTIKIEKPLIFLEKISSGVKEIYSRLEPEKRHEKTTNIGALFEKSPLILPGVDSNHQPCD